MLYDIGFALFSVAYLPALIAKGKLHRDFGERFGKFGPEKEAALAAAKDAIWIEAVSVGEVALCRTLIPALKERYPGSTIVLSTVTKTGNDLARKLFADDAVVIYFPLDCTAVVRTVINRIRPRAYIMIETELWPNVLGELARRGVPAILMNGRISDRSFGQYRMVRPFLRPVLKGIASFCMQSPLDAERITAMGAPAGRVAVTGTMKFDLSVPAKTRPAAEVLRSLGLDADAELIVAGSTHAGEEEGVLDAYKGLLTVFPRMRLLVAPRHIDRVPAVERTIRDHGFSPRRVSQVDDTRTTDHGPRVLLLDTIGKLGGIYGAATIVYIGGSLIPRGGQNPIEPAVLGKPVVFGPHMHNFRTVAGALLAGGGALQVADARGLAEALAALLRDPARRAAIGAQAGAVIDKNRGATERNLAAFEQMMGGTHAA